LPEFAASRIACLEPAQEPFGQWFVRTGFEGGRHRRGDLFVADDIADGTAIRALAFRVNGLDPAAVEEGGAAMPVDHRELPPTDGRIAGRQFGNGLLGGFAGLQEVEAPRPQPRVGAVLGQDGADPGAGIRAAAADGAA
jgi:hypothetical protein